MPFRIKVDVNAVPTPGQTVGTNSYEIQRLTNSLYSAASQPSSTDLISSGLLFDFDIGNRRSYSGSGTTILDLKDSTQLIQSDLMLVYDPGDTFSYLGSGTTLSDLSGNQNTGTLNGGVTYDAQDQSLILNGTDAYISTAKQFNNPQKFSIGIWFKTATTSTIGKVIGFTASQTGEETSNYDRQLYFAENGHLYFGIYENSHNVISSGIKLNDTAWHYVVATYSNGIMKLYVDTVYIEQLAVASAENYNGYWKIGSFAYGGWPKSSSPATNYTYPSGGYFNGKIGPVHIYDVELTENQIRQNYNAYSDSKGITPVLTGPWSTVATTKTFFDENVVENKRYYYRSRFTQNNGKISPFSEIVNVVGGSRQLPPNAPSLTATSSATSIANFVTLSFSGVPGTGHSIRNYTIERSTDLINWLVLSASVSASITPISYDDVGLASDTLYYYRVKFSQFNGVESPYSPVATIRTLSDAPTPTTTPTVLNLTIAEDGAGSGQYSFSRNHNNPTNTNRMFAWISSGSDIPISSVTYNSVSMTLIERFSSSSGEGGTRFVAVYSLMNPALGTNPVVVTTSDGQTARIEAFFVSVSNASSTNGLVVTLDEYDADEPFFTKIEITPQLTGGNQLFMVGARWRNSAADIVPESSTRITVDTEGLNSQSSRASLTYFNTSDRIAESTLVWNSNYGGVTQLGLAISGTFEIIPPQPTDVIFSFDAGNINSFSPGSTNLNDLGSNNNDAELKNGVFFISNENSGIFNFDGVDDYIQVLNQFNDPEEFSIDIWFKTDDITGKKLIGFENTNTQTGSTSYDRHLYIGTDGKLRFGVWDGSAKIVVSNSIVTNNRWYNAVVTYKTGQFSLYVNGVLQNSGTSNQAQNYLGYWKIGAYALGGWLNGTTGYFKGKIGPIKLYNRVLTTTEISSGFNSNLLRLGTPDFPAVNLNVIDGSSITITVTATPTTGSTITGYTIEKSSNGVDNWQQINSGTNNSYIDSGLNTSTTYYYRARFTQSNGESSPNSPVVNATTAAVSNIITDGLLFNFDSNDVASYPGSGSDINDVGDASLAPTPPSPVAPGTDLLFPRLGVYWIGGSRDYGSPASSDILSCCEINMLGWFDNAAHSPRGLEQMIQNIKAKATFPQYFYTYTRVNEFYHSRIFGENFQEPQVLLDKLTNNNWWLYPGSRTTGDIKYAQITAFDRVTKQLATSFASGTTTIRLQPTITLTLSSITGTFQSNEEVFVGTSLTSFNFKGRNNRITSGAMVSNNSILGATDTARSLIGKTVRGATSNATANITNVSINLSGVGIGRSIRGPGLDDNTVINSAVSLSLDSIFPAEVAITPATVSATSSGSYQIGPLAEVNITTFTVPDSRGLRAGEWLMELFGNQFVRSPAQGPTHPEFASILSNLTYAPSLDGLFIDNGFYPVPIVDGNWNRTGTNNTRSVIAPAWRTGYRDSARRFKSVFGKELVINSSSLNYETATPGNEYYREFDGGAAEYLIGDGGTPDGSISYTADFYENNVDVFRRKYRSVWDTYLDKKRAVTHCTIRGATDYELQAYAMALNMVMGDAACYLVGGEIEGPVSAPTWLDEIAVNKQTGQCYNGFSASGVKSGLRWLGKALEPGKAFPVNGVLPAPFVSGTSIFRRKFEFGEVYVNYRSSTTTFNLERPMKKLIGTQRPTVNNGQTVTSLTMGPKTAVFLLYT